MPHGQTRLDADTDDVHRLLDRLTDKPAMVFDSHSGAIVVLELLSARIDGWLDRLVEWSGTLGACAAAVGGARATVRPTTDLGGTPCEESLFVF